MPNRIRILKHEAVPGCGSFEVTRYPNRFAAKADSERKATP
ncbi:MAG: hypothetical protein ABWY82_13890 [Tardiphaga sp.]|jgi:hypothetical protein